MLSLIMLKRCLKSSFRLVLNKHKQVQQQSLPNYVFKATQLTKYRSSPVQQDILIIKPFFAWICLFDAWKNRKQPILRNGDIQ